MEEICTVEDARKGWRNEQRERPKIALIKHQHTPSSAECSQVQHPRHVAQPFYKQGWTSAFAVTMSKLMNDHLKVTFQSDSEEENSSLPKSQL